MRPSTVPGRVAPLRHARHAFGALVVAGILAASLAACGSSGSSAADSSAAAADAAVDTSSLKCGDPSPFSSTVKVSYGLVSKSATTLPLVIGDSLGCFKTMGIDPDEIVAGASGTVCQQLTAGALDVGECSMNDTAQAIAKGAPLTTAFFTSQSVLPNLVMSKPGIKTWADLKGKIMMVANQHDNTYYFTKLMMAAHGLDITKDVTLVYAGSSTDRSAALFAGKVDAAILTAPYDYQAIKKGYTQLDDLTKYLPPAKYTGGGLVTTKKYLKEHGPIVSRIYDAQELALKYILDPANKAAVIKTIRSLAQLDEPTSAWVYKRLVTSGYYFEGGKVPDSGLQGIIEALVKIGYLKKGEVKPSDLYDYSALGR